MGNLYKLPGVSLSHPCIYACLCASFCSSCKEIKTKLKLSLRLLYWFTWSSCPCAERGGECSAWLALHRRDGCDHRAAGHHCAVHLHPLGGGRGGGQPGAHLAGLQVRKLETKGGTVINNMLVHHIMIIMRNPKQEFNGCGESPSIKMFKSNTQKTSISDKRAK